MKWFNSSNQESGDTIIEVLLGLAIISAVAVGAVAVMNRGLHQSITATEITQVRQYINQQSEFLHYIRDAYARASDEEREQPPASFWTRIKDQYDMPAGEDEILGDPCKPGEKAFYIAKDEIEGINRLRVENYGTAEGSFPDTIATPGEGMWINAVFKSNPSEEDAPNYVDFYVKSCWSALNSGPNQQQQTVVRLYDALD